MDKYPLEEDIISYKNNLSFVFSKYSEVDSDFVEKEYVQPYIKNIRKMHKDITNQNKEMPFLIFATLFIDDRKISVNFVNYLYDFCIQNKINFYGFILLLLGWDFSEFKRISKNKIKFIDMTVKKYYQNSKDFDKLSLLEHIIENLQRVHSYRPTEHNLVDKYNFYQKVLENSFDEIKNRVQNNICNIDLPLEQYNIEKSKVLEEIETQKEYSTGIFNYKNSLAQMKQDNHFLSYLKNDKLHITDDNKIIFEGHTNALSLGYTDKAILLSLDKRSIVRELEIKLKHLSHFDKNGTSEFTLLAKALLEFIKQNKAYSNYVPYKSLSKIMGISKNKVKRYAKEFIGINEKSFMDNFEKIKTHTK